jgi:hypothetical protein
MKCARADINAYIKEAAGDSPRRTSARGTRPCSQRRSAARGVATSGRATTRTIRAAADAVAEHLGNTAAVARSSYIDPRVTHRYVDGEVIDARVPAAEPGATISSGARPTSLHGDSRCPPRSCRRPSQPSVSRIGAGYMRLTRPEREVDDRCTTECPDPNPEPHRARSPDTDAGSDAGA